MIRVDALLPGVTVTGSVWARAAALPGRGSLISLAYFGLYGWPKETAPAQGKELRPCTELCRVMPARHVRIKTLIQHRSGRSAILTKIEIETVPAMGRRFTWSTAANVTPSSKASN